MPAGWTGSGACISGSTARPKGATSQATGCATTTRTTSAEPTRGCGQIDAHGLASGGPTGGAAMKAAVLHQPNQPLTIEDVAVEKPKGREVVLRTAFAGLCHSD